MKPVKPVAWALLGIFSVYLAVAAASAYKEGSNIFVSTIQHRRFSAL